MLHLVLDLRQPLQAVLSAEILLESSIKYLFCMKSFFSLSNRVHSFWYVHDKVTKISTLKNKHQSELASHINNSAVIFTDYQTKYYPADNPHNGPASITLIILQYLRKTQVKVSFVV